jgi:hypothetical protein
VPPGLRSRYRDLEVLDLSHETRGVTQSLPVRRRPVAPAASGRRHRMAAYEPLDLLARRHLGSEELVWRLQDANGGRAADAFAPGEVIAIPALEVATRVARPG